MIKERKKYLDNKVFGEGLNILELETSEELALIIDWNYGFKAKDFFELVKSKPTIVEVLFMKIPEYSSDCLLFKYVYKINNRLFNFYFKEVGNSDLSLIRITESIEKVKVF